MPERKPLEGRVVAVPEMRELGRLTNMLEELGAHTLKVPLVTTREAPDSEPVALWLREFVRGGFDYLILLTSEGVRRLFSFAERMGLQAEFHKALAGVRTVTRGHKASRALGEVGLLPSLSVETPTTDGVIDALRDEEIDGRVVGVQLYGQDRNLKLEKFLDKAGAQVRTVAPYSYARGIDDEKVVDLIYQLEAGSVDIIAFTCGTQVERLFEVAESRHIEEHLRSGLTTARIAAVGPVAATALRKRGFRIDIVPRSSFFLRSLVNEIAAALRPSAPQLKHKVGE